MSGIFTERVLNLASLAKPSEPAYLSPYAATPQTDPP